MVGPVLEAANPRSLADLRFGVGDGGWGSLPRAAGMPVACSVESRWAFSLASAAADSEGAGKALTETAIDLAALVGAAAAEAETEPVPIVRFGATGP